MNVMKLNCLQEQGKKMLFLITKKNHKICVRFYIDISMQMTNSQMNCLELEQIIKWRQQLHDRKSEQRYRPQNCISRNIIFEAFKMHIFQLAFIFSLFRHRFTFYTISILIVYSYSGNLTFKLSQNNAHIERPVKIVIMYFTCHLVPFYVQIWFNGHTHQICSKSNQLTCWKRMTTISNVHNHIFGFSEEVKCHQLAEFYSLTSYKEPSHC